MRINSKIIKLIIVSLVLMFSLNYTSLVNASIDETPPIEAVPPLEVIKIADPIGTLTNSQIRQLKSKISAEALGDIFYFDGVYQTYDGYHDRGAVLIAGPNNTSSPNTATYTIKRTISNGFNTTIGASADFVSANVGFNVKWSEERSWSYTVTVNPGKTVYVYYRDWYHVKKFNCHKYNWITGASTYGTGFAEQWYAPQFYSVER